MTTHSNPSCLEIREGVTMSRGTSLSNDPPIFHTHEMRRVAESKVKIARVSDNWVRPSRRRSAAQNLQLMIQTK